MFFTYQLVDERTEKVLYVGVTGDLAARLKQHIMNGAQAIRNSTVKPGDALYEKCRFMYGVTTGKEKIRIEGLGAFEDAAMALSRETLLIERLCPPWNVKKNAPHDQRMVTPTGRYLKKKFLSMMLTDPVEYARIQAFREGGMLSYYECDLLKSMLNGRDATTRRDGELLELTTRAYETEVVNIQARKDMELINAA